MGHCQSCFEGYNLANTACLIQSQNQQSSGSVSGSTSVPAQSSDLPSVIDPLCYQYSNKKCVKCAYRSYLNPSTQLCA
jgi:hypothetical protein